MTGHATARLCCAVGLLLLVSEVMAFGVDLANDTVGYLLVAGGSWRVARRASPAARWRTTSVIALAACVLSLFSFGGPLTVVLSQAPPWWEAVSSWTLAADAAVFAALVLALSSPRGAVVTAEGRAVPPSVSGGLAVALCVLAVPQVLLTADPVGYSGLPGVVRRAAAGVVGLAKLLVVVLAFTASGVGRRVRRRPH